MKKISLTTFFFFFFIINLHHHYSPVTGVGVNYGTLGNNLPHPKRVAQLLQSTLIDTVKIYDTNPEILQAFSNTAIDLIVAAENSRLSNLSSDPSQADHFLSSRILPFLPSTSIVAIAVGNEYLTSSGAGEAGDLVGAMRNLHASLSSRGLDRKIKITTPHSMAILASSFPPSSSTFAPNLAQTMEALLTFLAETNSPFMINAYPYFAYRDNPETIALSYALLGNDSRSPVRDPNGFEYTNMLDAQIDAVRSAIVALGFGNRSIKIAVSESGWPSKGEAGDIAATKENAKTYNSRLVERAQTKIGTPMSPGEAMEVFVFSLFNENKKKGLESERNFGILNPDLSRVYELDLNCAFCSETASFGSSAAKGPSVWCVAKPHAEEEALTKVVDFCCGAGGVDCREIEENGECYRPERVWAHASYVMNAYYQMHGRNYWNCDFKGNALVTFTDPSYGSCRYSQQ